MRESKLLSVKLTGCCSAAIIRGASWLCKDNGSALAKQTSSGPRGFGMISNGQADYGQGALVNVGDGQADSGPRGLVVFGDGRADSGQRGSVSCHTESPPLQRPTAPLVYSVQFPSKMHVKLPVEHQ